MGVGFTANRSTPFIETRKSCTSNFSSAKSIARSFPISSASSWAIQAWGARSPGWGWLAGSSSGRGAVMEISAISTKPITREPRPMMTIPTARPLSQQGAGLVGVGAARVHLQVLLQRGAPEDEGLAVRGVELAEEEVGRRVLLVRPDRALERLLGLGPVALVLED